MPRRKRPERKYGEGTIFQRNEDGVYVGRITITDGTGKRKPKSVYGKTYDEVEAKLNDVLKSLAQGLFVATRDQTTAQYLTAWLEDTVKPHLASRTYEDYAETVKRHIEPHIGTIVLDKLTPQDVQRMIVTVTKNISPQMGNRCRRTLRTALTRAMKWGYVARNVASLTDAPKVTPREMTALAPEDAKTLLKTVAGDRLEALYTVALALGLRQGEALGLRWQDIDVEARSLTVRYQLQRVDGKPALVEPKTAKSRRTLTLPTIAVDALRRHRIRQLEERLWAGSRWQEGGFVFTSTIGTPVDEHNLRKQFRALVKKAELPPMRFHDLRHSAASLLAAQGANARDVMETLGHTQIATTMNLYTHVFTERKAELAAMMDAALTPQQRKSVQ
ncbi:MAG: site-specific integrase [Gemmatimonadaceae bacterium]